MGQWSASVVIERTDRMCRVILGALLYCTYAAHAIKLNIVPTTPPEFRLAAMYGNNMVLQMEPKSANIWGYGKPFSEIILEFNDEHFTTTVAQNGTWSISLPPQPVGGPYLLTFKHIPFSIFCIHNTDTRHLLRDTVDKVVLQLNCASDILQLDEVMFGDVWVCSGGSNMAQELNTIKDAEEIKKLVRHQKMIRVFQASRYASQSPRIEPGVVREWETIDQEVLLDYFPALCLLYAMNMAELVKDRPIGMIEAAWGGTPIEAWVSPDVTKKCRTPETKGSDQYSNHALWNGMIYPLTKMTVRGAIWHQGATNTAYNKNLYLCHFEAMIADWRKNFLDAQIKNPEENDIAFPFGFVQLGPSYSTRDLDWWTVRSQLTTHVFNSDKHRMWMKINMRYIPETFMASSYDLLDPPGFNVTGLGSHYRDKETAAKRLAAAARQLLYVQPDNVTDDSFPQIPRLVHFNSVRSHVDELILNVTFSTRIHIIGTKGFAVKLTNKSIVPIPLADSWSHGVILKAPVDAETLYYGWGAAPCGYERCAVYSELTTQMNSEDVDTRLPANVFSINIS